MSDRGDECMNKRDMKFKAESIVRQLFRDNGISERFGVTECVSGIIDSFRQDNNLGNSGTQENKTVSTFDKIFGYKHTEDADAHIHLCDFINAEI